MAYRHNSKEMWSLPLLQCCGTPRDNITLSRSREIAGNPGLLAKVIGNVGNVLTPLVWEHVPANGELCRGRTSR